MSNSGGLEPKQGALLTSHEDEDRVGILLPCEVNRFGEFISGLLGQRQIIDGLETGSFDIGSQDIANAFHLLAQRVEAQNEASLAALSIKVIYSSGNSVTHNSVAAFEAYHPIEPGHPVEVVLRTTYLVRFKASAVPEKQTIEMAFIAAHHPWREPKRMYYGEGAIEYRVEYTERTWGSDISALLNNHAKTLVNKQVGVFSWLSRYNDDLSAISLVLLFVVTMGGWSWYTSQHASSLVSIEDLTNYGAWSTFIFIALAGLFRIINYTFEHFIFLYNPSFITLVERDRQHRDKQLKRKSRQKLAAGTAWVMSVVASVVASYAYAALVS